jgi:hypothetical protein
MKNHNKQKYIFKSGISERQSIEFVYRIPKVFLFLIIVTPIFHMLSNFVKEGNIDNFSFLFSIMEIGKILLIPSIACLVFFLFNASFTLYSFELTRNAIYKLHFIYKWKSREINIEEIEFVEAIPVMWQTGYFHLIFYSQQKDLKIEGLKWEVGKTAIKKINELNLKVYIRKENSNKTKIDDKLLEEFQNENIQFNDKNYDEFIEKHPKHSKIFY